MTHSFMTWEEAVLHLRLLPEYEALILEAFLDDPLLDSARSFYDSSEWKATQQLLNHDQGTVLDIGAGRGLSSYAFAKDGWNVTALEPDSSRVVGTGAIRSLSRESGMLIEVVEAWGEQIPFADGSFDLVYGRQVLHHAADLKKLCSEMARVLKFNGRFIAVREHVVLGERDLGAFLNKHPLHTLYGGENAFRLKEYRTAISNAGIELTEVINPWASPINYYPRTTEELATSIAKKLPLIHRSMLSAKVMSKLGWLYRSHGAVYSFAGVKRA